MMNYYGGGMMGGMMNPFGSMTTLSTMGSMFISVALLAVGYVLYNELNDTSASKDNLDKREISETWLTAFSRKTPDEAKRMIITQFPEWPARVETIPFGTQSVSYIRSKLDDGIPTVFLIVGQDGRLVEWGPSRGLYTAPVQVFV